MIDLSLVIKVIGLLIALILFLYGLKKKGIKYRNILLFSLDKDQIYLFIKSYEVPTIFITLLTLLYYVQTKCWIVKPEIDWIVNMGFYFFLVLAEYLIEIDFINIEELRSRGIYRYVTPQKDETQD